MLIVFTIMASSDVSDVIVIGAGVEGSATAFNIASHGKKVLLLEQVRSCKSGIVLIYSY